MHRDIHILERIKMGSVNRFIRICFHAGFSNREILCLLAHSRKTIISTSTLKRKLKSLGLFRRKNHSDLLEVALFILQQQESSGVLHGYRWMHLKCIQSGLTVPRDTVYQLMCVLDPDGIKSRLRKRLVRRRYASPGANFVWHIDSYDKLKPYGIAINGCIDGYSRYVIWLEASTTNSDPKVIGNYFIGAVKERAGCPKRIRGDLGTENVYVEDMQTFLRRDHPDEFARERSFICGRSTQNQRIEWFWGLVRKEMAQFYMDMFAYLSQDGAELFCGDMLDKNLILFCFMRTIQVDLDELRVTWNTHTLQTKPDGIGGGKRPLLLYTLPQLYNAEDHLCPADESEILICESETTPKKTSCSDDTVFQLCSMLMAENNMKDPNNAVEAKEMYIRLREIIRHELDSLF